MFENIKPRHIKLFKLLASQESFKPASFFSDALNVSTKTIISDVDVINECLISTSLNVDKIPRKGIQLVGKLEEVDEVLKQFLLSNEEIGHRDNPVIRQLEIVKRLVINNNEVIVTDLEDEFYVSLTSIRSDIDAISEVFNAFDVTISTSKNKIEINGIESNIQKGLKHFILDFVISDSSDSLFLDYDPLTQVLNQLFEEKLVSMINQEVSQLVENIEKAISNWFTRSLHVTLLIQISRILHHHHMSDIDSKYETINQLESYILALELIEHYERDFGLVFHSEDIYYLSQQLYAHGIVPKPREIIPQDDYLRRVNEMITAMSEHVRVDLTGDEKLRKALLSHLPPMIYRLRHKIDVKNPLLEEIRNQYIVLFSLTWYVSIALEQEYDVVLNDNEISFLFIYFQVSIERRYQHQFKNIIVVCPYGLATSELVFTRVRQVIPYIDNISIMTTEELKSSDLKNIDYIISTVKLDISEPEVVYVSPLMTDADIQKVLKYDSSYTSKFNRLGPSAVDEYSSFKDLFDPKLVFPKDHAYTREKALEKLINGFEEQGFTDEGFAEGIYEREEMGDTSLYTGVALPHAFPSTVKQSKIGIMTLEKGIKWGSNSVSVVILIAISERDSHRIKQVLSKLLVLLESQELIEELRQISDSEEIINKIQQMF